MKRILTLIFLSIFTIGLITACGPGDESSTDDEVAEETADTEDTEDTEAVETGGTDEEDGDEEEIHAVLDKLDEEGWIVHSGSNLTIPDEFPSDYPLLDNYNVVDRIIGLPDSHLGEQVELKFRYDDASTFLEAVEFYLDYYENGDFDVDNLVVRVEPTDEEGDVDIISIDSDGMTHYFVIEKMSGDDFYHVKIKIKNEQ